MSKAWKVGDYHCCRGRKTCASNILKKHVDDFMKLAKRNPDTAREALYEWVANLEESLEFSNLKRFYVEHP